ncbi:putative alanyl-tRNA synthetase [Cavenderia fasciculata]|uniref:Alanyl-tRNA synthetase n=1 Tax=Cavenderia fasciculata TaxID=261658 RepID=F4Q7F4_CACFS|nr:putative alanyl-tRNA synthetase [Cavenderia fasciculata]EGG16336.1 putative alanyl-tRNA synthetase [Cavenderia fasciculata]|eukprot:XP_004354720.1 putative alanyl-tRNA synthetase [Cavenderia fasciculata]
MSKVRDPITDTACHILKGAVVTVLGTPVTASVECNNKVKGRLTVEYDSDVKPSDENVKRIEKEANNIVKANLPLKAFSMDRKEAETKYTESKVNNTYIYDKFPVPESVTTLTLVEIENWNINCCPAQHLEKTGDIGYIKIIGTNHRPQKKEFELRFEIVSKEAVEAEQAAQDKSRLEKEKKIKDEQDRLKRESTNIELVTKRVMEITLANQQDKSKAITEISTLLNILKNNSYMNGMNCTISKQ